MNDISKKTRESLQTLSYMKRFNNVLRLHEESVAEHSFYVSVYTMILCDMFRVGNDIKSVAIQKALVHDIHEVDISDIPHNVKEKVNGLLEWCDGYESEYFEKEFEKESDEYSSLEDIQKRICDKIVLLADIISVKQYVEKELEFGNEARFLEVKNNTDRRIERTLKELKEIVEVPDFLFENLEML